MEIVFFFSFFQVRHPRCVEHKLIYIYIYIYINNTVIHKFTGVLISP